MSLIQAVIERVKRDYFRWDYARRARSVLATAPLSKGELPFLLLSMVQKRDVVPYLVAAKTFTRFLNPSRIVVVCDPSIDDADRAVLSAHIPHIELRRADEFTDPRIPRGGTWERLYAIAHYTELSYVIQLDADTVTTQTVAEVLAAVQADTAFTLVESQHTLIKPLTEVRTITLPKVKPDSHIQRKAEAIMATVGLPAEATYIRGCSGFAGFPKRTTMREEMLDFSGRMFAALGEDWKRWGTEQVTSNYLVANSPGALALPFPKFGTPNLATADTAFYHFIGSMRFINNQYGKTSERAIALLAGAPR